MTKRRIHESGENTTNGRAAETSAESLREATFRGVRWVAAARIGGEVLAFAGALALARLITPAEFGRAAVALAFVPLAVILTFEGCASALVQRPTVTRAHVHGAMLLSLVAGAALSVVIFAFGGTLGDRVFGDRTGALIELIAPVFMLASVGATSRALMWRQLDFRQVSVIEILGLLVGTATAVGFALGGLNGEALVLGALANQGAASAMLFARRPVTPRISARRTLRDITSFGLPAAFAGLVAVAFTNANYLIVAAKFPATQAGLYWRGFQLGVAYQEKISGIMMRVAFPVYSRASDREALRDLHRRATRLHATTLFPLLSLVAVTAPVLVPFLFGPAWEGAVLPAQLLAFAGMMAAVLTGYPQVMLAIGRPKTLLRFNCGMLAVYVVATLVAVPFGLNAVCLSVVGVYAGTVLAVYALLLRPSIGVEVRSLVPDLGPALVGCAALLAIGFPLEAALEARGAGAPVVLAVVGLAGSAVYLAVIRRFFAGAWSDVALFAVKLRPRRPGRRREDAHTVAALSSGAP